MAAPDSSLRHVDRDSNEAISRIRTKLSGSLLQHRRRSDPEAVASKWFSPEQPLASSRPASAPLLRADTRCASRASCSSVPFTTTPPTHFGFPGTRIRRAPRLPALRMRPFRSRRWSGRRLSEASQRTNVDGRSHDYQRNGTLTLLAVSEVARARSLPLTKQRRRVEFLDVMDQIVAAYPADTALHA